ncbi:MAG: hypothetical protein HYW65_00995 [Candidatus Liptonbacteria bacterium]|nr:hypothetical protein [Candidatus Liptonbacteria bacterium]
MKNRLDDRLKKITRLTRQRDRIESELSKLLGMDMPKTKSNELPASLPQNISLNEQILEILKEKGRSMRILEIKRELDQKFQVSLERRNVQAAIHYMARQKNPLIEKAEGYGMFALKKPVG